MKKPFKFSAIVVSIFILFIIQSCKKEQDTTPVGPELLSVSSTSVTLNDEVVVTGKGFSTNDADNVVKLDDQQVEVFNSSSTQLSIKIRENITIGAKKLTLSVSSKKADASLDMKVYGWQKVTDHPSGGFFEIASFSIDNNIYFCNAVASGDASHISELWRYNLTDNTWTKLKDFPGANRFSVTCFALNGKGYQVLGEGDSPVNSTEVWEYDPALDKWTQLTDFPGAHRSGQFCFILNGKAYVGGGFTYGAPGSDQSDVYSFTPGTNTWHRVADIPEKVYGCASFVVNSKAYVAGGVNMAGIVQKTYQYDDVANTWTPKADFPSPNSENLLSFGLNSTGYCGLGAPLGNEHGTTAIWSFNPDLNTWTPIAPFRGEQRRSYLIGTAGKYAYYGMGSESKDYSDLWIYAPKDYTP